MFERYYHNNGTLALSKVKEHNRPIPAGRVSPNRPVSQIQILRTGGPQSSHWRPHPIGHELPDATGRFGAMNVAE